MSAQLSVAPDLLSIREIGPWLRECVSGHVADADVEPFAMRAELAMQEVAANIVNHGHVGVDPADHPPIGLAAEIADGALRIEIVDHGTEYEPDAQPEPKADAPQVHGYGLMIVRQLARRFDYVRRDDANHTTLEFELPDSSSN